MNDTHIGQCIVNNFSYRVIIYLRKHVDPLVSICRSVHMVLFFTALTEVLSVC